MAIAFALSARLGRWRGAEEEGYEEEAEDIGEVLIIGQLTARLILALIGRHGRIYYA
jgi:hypothetical protein